MEVRIAGEAVSFHGVAALDVWAVRADVADYCLAVVGRNWLSENLALILSGRRVLGLSMRSVTR